ncbi:MAG TPA: hypothetical protein VGP25_16005 [Gemmatimonadaceae bacterium]|jgi:hypothetical protein|nr:hypothetical protein [Gemmatimonadaceae bacterium]
MTAAAPIPTARVLLRALVDYAGLFPPAALSMHDAAAQYSAHLGSPDAWMLGRFVVPVERLEELALVACSFEAPPEPWRLSVLVGDDVISAGARVREFNAAYHARFVVDMVECRPMPIGSVVRSVGALPGELRSFVELSDLDDPRPMLDAINSAGAWAKVRTGGVSVHAFPSASQLATFISSAAELRVPFKATAGLHHPLAGEYALTYAPDSPTGGMFGFLNVFAAAVFALGGATEPTLVELLVERDAESIRLDDDGIHWHGLTANATQIAKARDSLALSFGSCSFAEPVDGLRSMRLL